MYNFGIMNYAAFVRAKQWLKTGAGKYLNGKPPVDNATDNNYQNYSDNAAGTGAISTFREANASNQFEVNAGHTLIDNSLTINAVPVPATPTAAVNGTAGSTSIAYRIVGRAGSLQAPSAALTVATANATLTAANSITLSFVPTPGFLTYDIYRVSAAGTPSTTGRIGTVNAALGSNVSSPTLTFTDTGLTADGSTVPSTNTTGAVTGDLNVYGNLNLNALATPHAPLATVAGTAGSSTNAYKIVARSGSPTTATGHTVASAATTVTTCNATLSAANYVNLVWQPVPGAVSYDVYRTTASGTSPTTTGLIGSTTSTTGFNDTGLAGDSASAPVTNTTGQSSLPSSTTPSFVSVNDANGNVEVNLAATASAVDYITVTNGATGAPGLVSIAADGSDSNVSLTVTTKGTGVMKVAPAGATGTLLLGGTAQSGATTLGSSSVAATVNIAAGAGAPTVAIANVSTAGATVNVAGAATANGNTDTVNVAAGNTAGTGAKTVNIATGAPAGTGVDTVNIATGNAASTAAKKVNIATGTPNTSGNNQVVIGGGTTSAVTFNAVVTTYQAVNYQGTEGGANNALTCNLTDAGGNSITLAAGLRIALKVAHTLQAGANSLAINSGSVKNIKSHLNVANNIAAAYAVGSIVDLMYDGTQWQDMGQ